MKLSNIDASLSKGRFFTGIWLAFIYSFLGICAFSILLSFFAITMGAVFGEKVFIFIFGSLALISAFFSIIPIQIIVINKKIEKQIKLCLGDAIQLKGVCEKLNITGVWKFRQAHIEIRFKHNGKKHKKRSIGGTIGGRNGYNRVFTKYADKEVNILYSPKYDQVFILKGG